MGPELDRRSDAGAQAAIERKAFTLVIWTKSSTVDTAKRVLVELDRLGLPKTHSFTVNEPGVGGGVLDALREMGATARGYNPVSPLLPSGTRGPVAKRHTRGI